MFNQPIGVFDSGIGGLTVLRALQTCLPHEHYIYLGDTARLPYGVKSADTIKRYAEQAAVKLISQGIKLLVIACNTASAQALDHLQKTFPDLPIIGVIEPGAQAACAASQTKQISVIATEGTVKCKAYEKAIYTIDPHIKVTSKSCSLFVSLAEEGWLTGHITEAVAREYLEPLLKNDAGNHPDCLVLGCTHFPILLPTIRQVAGSGIHIVDSAHTTALAVKKLLTEKDLLTRRETLTSPTFLATDSIERFAKIACWFLEKNLTAGDIQLVDIS